MPSRVRRSVLPLLALTTSAILLLGGCAADAETPATDDTGDIHEVTHARGTTEVPADVERVVTLEPLELDTAVAVGITPVGAAVASNVASTPSYLGVDAVRAVGTVPEPDLEAIAALEPDLILGTEARHSALYEQLSAIAPTVFIETQADPWRNNALLIGEALNKEDEVADLLAEVDQRCEDLSDQYGVDGKTAQLIRPRDETTLSLYGPVSFAGSLLECAGYTIPDQDWADGLQADISPENILDATADEVFVTTADVEDQGTVPAPVTQNAAAFPSVTLVDTSYWVSGVGPKGAHAVLDDIEKHLEAKR
ncbi:iron ABC transporter substrate-binding protein [Microbacterium sp. SZ1]|uniref:ABC transporter substrate-binding protein n=1 Tax=Microbacterium sp. SZ1 TaxID=1849736 RepID=UPI000BCDF605|nr:iron-siderophore ABC transporter substrate-binding protein [Microbacterium sp. SZ1]PCE15770.1 iron ABC transporter substrate-binding protein [Microbacterium sp. SZ1]